MRGVDFLTYYFSAFSGYVVGSILADSFREFSGNNDAEGPVASAPADNDDV